MEPVPAKPVRFIDEEVVVAVEIDIDDEKRTLHGAAGRDDIFEQERERGVAEAHALTLPQLCIGYDERDRQNGARERNGKEVYSAYFHKRIFGLRFRIKSKGILAF
jgi:hypothetical protein